MVATLGGFALGLLLLALGGDSAVKGVSGLGQRLGLRPFAAGVLLLAFATSIPELAVNLRAVAIGQGHLALGNAVGSTLANLGLTLGLAALAAPLLLHARLLLPQLVLLVAAVLVLVLLGLDGYVGRIDGLVLVAAFIVALAHVLRRAAREAPEVQQGIAGYAATRTVPWLNLLRLAIAIPLLWFGARWVVSAGLDLGRAWGLTPLLAGLLPVAIGSTLPEIAAAIAAARRGQGDMVAGHVFGSSLCNLLLVVGGTAAVQPLALPASFVRLELPALLVLAALAWPMLRGDRRLSRGEGGVLVAVFAAWIVLELALL
ncbi:sodium:calcium antiporter [Pseudoxanthomonas sp. SGNA-20]|uniref:sodium:calcium antiporter n=1 Tax=unclassified Pseudoxanthomonas TaxID=2645906 RepID=UPI0002EAAD56|nr:MULTISPECIES: sodium:calcium antiporter [unclassified Pseudoxanthomonas]RRN56306.1 sodium:calcium antiporter [Pseudoxanthomonas sp. SGNA-20]